MCFADTMSSLERQIPPQKPHKSEKRHKTATNVAAIVVVATSVLLPAGYGIARVIGPGTSNANQPRIAANGPQQSPAGAGKQTGKLECEQSSDVHVDNDTGIQYKNIISGAADTDGSTLWSFAAVTSRRDGKGTLFAHRGDNITLSNHIGGSAAQNTSLAIDLFVSKQPSGYAPPPGSESTQGFSMPSGKHPQDYVGNLVVCGGTLSIDNTQSSTGNSNSSSTNITINE